MHTYHLFVIQRNIFDAYLKKTGHLFVLLKKLYQMDKKNLQYGFSLYQQLCAPIHVKILTDYIIEKVPAIKIQKNTFKMLSFFESTTIYLHYTNITVETDEILPSIYEIFSIYHDHIFVCDFQENKYFWLREGLKKMETIGKKHI